jgi:uncharacterized protein
MPLMEFPWDENKRLSNLAKHGLDFEDAHWVFTDEAFAAEDTRSSMGSHALFCTARSSGILWWSSLPYAMTSFVSSP